MKEIKIEMNCVLLNLRMAEKHMSMSVKDLEMASHRMTDARKSLEEIERQIEKCIKKAN